MKFITSIGAALLLLGAVAASVPPYASDSFVPGITGRATGFVHMEEVEGRWWAIDPLGRGFYFAGIQSANMWGVRDFLTRRRVYEENCLKTYGTQARWEEDCLAKLKAWGFNMLGHGCQQSLECRGLVHARELGMTQALCRGKDADRYICKETTPACSAFPNVFHPDFERYCQDFARKHCAPHRENPWVAGWYVDNELAWWGDREAHYRPRCNGLYETVARLPATHSARRALDAFLAQRGVAKGGEVPDALKREFLLHAAARYFSVTAAAIREADPNHLLLGARFAGLTGAADPEVFAIAAKHSDVLTFNCYPWADLDRNEVRVSHDGARVSDAFGELYARTRKPFLITEWSFPALDAGLPCSGGAGQRFATQSLRAQASELWMKTLLALPYVAGWNFFRWVDQPASGIARYNREDTNYGLVNERNEPYVPLVEAFTRVQHDVLALRRAGLPPARAPKSSGGSPRDLLDALEPPAKVAFSRTGKTFRVDAGAGCVFTGEVGGGKMLASIALGERVVGSYGAMVSRNEPGGRRVWTDVSQVADVSWRELPKGRGELTLRARGGDTNASFAVVHRLTFAPGSSKFLCECLHVENTGPAAVDLDRVYFRLFPAFQTMEGGAAAPQPPVPPCWKIPRQAAWTSPRGLLLGAMTTADNLAVFRFYVDEKGAAHPDMGFFPGANRRLAAGADWTPPAPMWVLATAAATSYGPPAPEPMFSPEQVQAIADEWDAKQRAAKPAAKPAEKPKPNLTIQVEQAPKRPPTAVPAVLGKSVDLGGGLAVQVDAKGGFAFRAAGRELAFEPFALSASESGKMPSVSFQTEGDALVVDVAGDEKDFGSVAFGRCALPPKELYFGYGYYVRDPGRFALPLNGHQNATRYAGFAFTNGLSLVLATTTPPENLYHDPETGSFGFRVTQPTRFTLVPGLKGAFDCAIRYRAHFATLPARGFAAKAGRFCVDSWNGSFRDFETFIRRASEDYGLKDDLLFYAHCWQRYGFDRHLPDVYPPSPTFGTADELKSACALAHAKGWNFGVHLNVIDCYTNSPWFGWEKICHEKTKAGTWEPAKAWLNPPHQEQSWRLLPKFGSDSIRYQVEQLLAGGFRPDTVFIDVTGSGSFGAATCRDRAGNVHSLIENTRENARMFDTARAALKPADGLARFRPFVSSEAPCDYLVGALDGGDCQWIHLDSEKGAYRWVCAPGSVQEKTPWFPLVYHDRISLHGVGYSARFEGARGEDCHGVDSDDYISCEVMNGHALMADCYNRDAYKAEAGILEPLDVDRCLRQTVRKYWLAQHVARELGTATVSRVSFVKGDPTHIRVDWSTGMKVFVNRGRADWACPTGDPGLDGIVLPQYGFVAFNKKTDRYAAIRRRGGRVVEESAYSEGKKVVRYLNPRGADTAVNRLPLAPATTASVKGSDTNRVVSVRTVWDLLKGQSRPRGRYQVSYWLLDPMFREYSPKSAAILAHTVEATLDQPLEAAFPWPADAKGVRVLHVAVSPLGADVRDPAPRLKLLGTAAFYKRYRQGTFDAKGAYAAYVCPDDNLWERLFPPSEPVDYGWIQTKEAFRLVSEPKKPDVKTLLP